MKNKQDDILYDLPLWYFESIFGVKYVNDNKDKSFEAFMNDAPQLFYMCITPKNVIISTEQTLVSTKRVYSKKIMNLRAYEIFGLALMEEAVSRTKSIMSRIEYRKKIIKEVKDV